MDKARNIFEQILSGLWATNENVVGLSEEVSRLREDVAFIKEMIQPSLTSAGGGADKAEKPKKK